MKKIIASFALGALSFPIYAQGLVSIAESAFQISTNATVVDGATVGPLGSVPNSYYFDVLTLSDPPGATSLPAINTIYDLVRGGWFDEQVYGTNGPLSFNHGKIIGIPAVPGVSANNWSAGSTNFFVVVGWSANEGSSWSTVANEISTGNWNVEGIDSAIGWSAVGYGASTSLSPGLFLFGSNPGQIGSFTLYDTDTPILYIPEPGSLALSGVGIFCLCCRKLPLR